MNVFRQPFIHASSFIQFAVCDIHSEKDIMDQEPFDVPTQIEEGLYVPLKFWQCRDPGLALPHYWFIGTSRTDDDDGSGAGEFTPRRVLNLRSLEDLVYVPGEPRNLI